METIKGFKGFKKGLKCSNFQYKENTEYKIKGTPELCNKGFHFCENPLDILDYYDLCDSDFAIDLRSFIKASIDYIFEKCETTKGMKAQSGYYSQSAQSGDSSQIELNGNDSVGASIGIKGVIKASKGCWITLAEYDDDDKILWVKSVKVTGKSIKSDTWYKLSGGKFTECYD